ncbi:hypothetical protein [Rubritalea tangerina]|uniref:hypothetical protein n=1 Tax=Rubritalea tangerina TaxID=430798 RepID=UPI0036161450
MERGCPDFAFLCERGGDWAAGKLGGFWTVFQLAIEIVCLEWHGLKRFFGVLK